MADVNRGNRPLSPHLTIYRPQWTTISSILVRITGNAMIVAALMLVWWFVAAAAGPAYFDCANWWITSWIGDLIMFASVWALFYHMLGGIRHLIWDNGYMLDVQKAENFAKVMVIVASLATIFVAIVV